MIEGVSDGLGAHEGYRAETLSTYGRASSQYRRWLDSLDGLARAAADHLIARRALGGVIPEDGRSDIVTDEAPFNGFKVWVHRVVL